MSRISNFPDRIGRRHALKQAGGAGAAALLAATATQSASAAAIIEQPAKPGKSAFLARAFAMRDLASKRGDQPYGAVVVKNGRIVGQAPSQVVTAKDPTAHAETEAIRDAARRLGTRNLAGCILYSSSPPCAMCETAAYWASIDRMIHGSSGTDGGRPTYGGCS